MLFNTHCWEVLPDTKGSWVMAVPLLVEAPSLVTARPLPTLIILYTLVPTDWMYHCCALLVLALSCHKPTPGVVDARGSSRYLPLATFMSLNLVLLVMAPVPC